jgi:hypothetical protein
MEQRFCTVSACARHSCPRRREPLRMEGSRRGSKVKGEHGNEVSFPIFFCFA